MKLLIINASVVFAGRNYAPSMLTPDFLRSIKVAKKDWEFSETPVLTPVMSLLRYNNGMIIGVDPERIQIIDGHPPPKITESPIASIAKTLVKHFAYARHTAIGININTLIEHESATDFLREKFIKDGAWLDQSPTQLNIGFAYPKDDTTLNLTFAVGTAKLVGESEQREGIVIAANYHANIPTDITLDASMREARKHIGFLAEREKDFRTLIGKIFPLEANDNGEY